ncbi:putative MFS family arabinose efflux permease [Lipingzhangella halophila]|uniref:Putative MFS family arabinose efflux permease n=1 Tax=Lipingzhangella halophila TaxID=1783352 RepID=A0A7W7W5V1_9ACTN|nr:MFS transporter [Lipingzhangella halophila]MBB4934244.1 putative MFS family arabinose efflux permease [Lipingzhangella halophila]
MSPRLQLRWPTGPTAPRWLWWLVGCVICTQTALNLARPLISYRAISQGGDALAIGLITAAYALLPLVIALPLGRLTDRVPRLAPIVVLGITFLALGPVLLAGSDSLGMIASASAALGLGHIIFMVAGQGLVARFSDESEMDRNFGWFTAGAAVGQMAGPLAAGFLLGEATGAALQGATSLALLIAAGAAACGIPAAIGLWLAGGEKPPAQRERGATARSPIGSLLRRPGVPSGLFVSLALLSAVDLLTAYLPLVAEHRGIAPSAVGVLLGLRAGCSILSRLLLSHLLTRWSRRTLIVTSALGAAGALAVVSLPWSGPAAMAGALAIGGFLLGVGQPLTMTAVVMAVPSDARSTALALRLWANRVGQVALPAGAGAVAGALGAAGALWFACFFLALAAGAAGAGRRD